MTPSKQLVQVNTHVQFSAEGIPSTFEVGVSIPKELASAIVRPYPDHVALTFRHDGQKGNPIVVRLSKQNDDWQRFIEALPSTRATKIKRQTFIAAVRAFAAKVSAEQDPSHAVRSLFTAAQLARPTEKEIGCCLPW